MSIYKNKKTGNANLHSQSLYLLLSYNSSANNRRNNCPSRRVALRPDLYFSVTSLHCSNVCSISRRISSTASQSAIKHPFSK